MKEKKIGKRIKILSNLLKRSSDASEILREGENITGAHGWIIGYLYENRDRDVFQRDVENNFKIRRPTATGILQRMEKNGLIRKCPVPYDQRLKKLTLTPKAVRLHEDILSEIRTIEGRLCKGLTEEEVDAFVRTADIMIENMQ